MTEEVFVDDYVKAFADHIQCDPELAQELYFKHKVSETLDNQQKASIDRELSALQIVSNNLDRAATIKYGQNIRHVFYGHVHRMTYVNWRGVPFTSLPSLNHQIPLNAGSVQGEFCDEPPAYGVVQIENDQLTVHFNTFLQRNSLHQT